MANIHLLRPDNVTQGDVPKAIPRVSEVLPFRLAADNDVGRATCFPICDVVGSEGVAAECMVVELRSGMIKPKAQNPEPPKSFWKQLAESLFVRKLVKSVLAARRPHKISRSARPRPRHRPF